MKAPKFTLLGFRRPREVFGLALGKLERAVMDEVWARGRASASDIYRAFGERTAYTTWMTTLDRLFKKGLLVREKEGRAYLYSQRVTREEFERGVAEDVLGGLLDRTSDGTEPLLVYSRRLGASRALGGRHVGSRASGFDARSRSRSKSSLSLCTESCTVSP